MERDSMKTMTQAPAMSGASTSVISPIVLWSLFGLVCALFSLSVFGQWLLSPTEFSAVAVTAADAMDAGTLQTLRIVEGISMTVAVGAVYLWLLRPWIKTGTPSIAGLLLVGALLTYVLDTTVNYADYHMAWNKHSLNFGTWASFFPGHTGPTQYAEAMLWGPPMYLYFGVALATIQLKVIDVLRPRIGLVVALAVSFVLAFCFDLIAESTIIQTSEAYAWPYVVGAWSVWSGTQFQFPLYESLLVAIYSSLYALLLNSARRQGVSFIERGVDQLPSALRLPARLLAATGFAAVCTTIYFGGFYLISQSADTRVEMPAYLQYSDAGWTPPQ